MKSKKTFSFHIGSCAMDVPLIGWWRRRIFRTMKKRKSDFMLWMGDFVYLVFRYQYSHTENIYSKYVSQSKKKYLKGYMKSRPQYAIWDDHDYAYNNSGAEFKNKKYSLEAFRKFWNQPAEYASDEGIYYSFVKENAEFFMLDCRYFKINGETLLGDKQREWLEDKLINSTAKFKFICSSIQVFCTTSTETWRQFPDFDILMNIINTQNIQGVVFFSGDVHYSEISRYERKGNYDLHEYTFSALTSLSTFFLRKNKYKVSGSRVIRNNFGEVKVYEDKVNISLFTRSGKRRWTHSLSSSELSS